MPELPKPYCEQCESRLQSLIGTLDGYQLHHVDSTKGCGSYKKGQVLFLEGHQPTGLFCLHKGKVKVYKTGDEGRDQIVRFARAGDVLGYRSLISGEPYSVSAAALEDSLVCLIPEKTFFDILNADGHFTMRIIQLLSGELKKAEERIVHLAQKPVRERLAEALLILREIYGTENGDSSPINVALSREDLANLVGTATETLVRTLAGLKRENLIATDKKKIRILDLQGLVRAGNLQD
jgi:CRP/FNR family transcriptional regulator